jgi:dynein light intermediate chain 2, cytosolic
MEKGDKKGPQFENDIFALSIQQMEDKQTEAPSEKTAIVIGEKGSGKSTLISALTGEEVKGERKPTAGMDYKYAIKKVEAKKIVGNFYEIGGGRLLADLIDTSLNAKKIKDSVFVITIDMSQPDTAMYYLDFWLKKVSSVVNKALDELNGIDPVLANQIREQSAFKWESHTDSKRVYPIPIPTIIVGTKYDVFGIEESENKKWMCRALRYFAHSNGCDLTFCSYREKDFSQIKQIINWYMYGSQKEPKLQIDHTKILSVLEGQDKLTSIGDPPIPGEMSLDQAWSMSMESYFPLKNLIAEDNDDQELGDISKFSEPKIDALKAQKDEELERSEVTKKPKKMKVIH